MALRTILSLVAVLVSVAHPADGQNEPVVPPTLQAGLLARFDEASSKVLQLGEAIPADKYVWRPTPGVRAISEVLVHVGLGNYYTTSDAGATPSSQVGDEAEQRITDLQHPTTMFGQSTTYQNVYLFGIAHVHEHLGQLTTYARMNGVVPPWAHAH